MKTTDPADAAREALFQQHRTATQAALTAHICSLVDRSIETFTHLVEKVGVARLPAPDVDPFALQEQLAERATPSDLVTLGIAFNFKAVAAIQEGDLHTAMACTAHAWYFAGAAEHAAKLPPKMMLPGGSVLVGKERDAKVLALLAEGQSPAKAGQAVGVTRQRVNEISAKALASDDAHIGEAFGEQADEVRESIGRIRAAKHKG